MCLNRLLVRGGSRCSEPIAGAGGSVRLLLAVAVLSFASVAVACASTPTTQDGGSRAREAREQCEDGVDAADAGRWEEAEFRWMKAVAIDPSAACGYNNLAVHYERDGDYDEAEEAYEKAMQVAAGDARAVVVANWEKYQEGRMSERELAEARAAGEIGAEDAAPGLGVMTYEITVSVPLAEGRYLADFERVLVGNFVVVENDTGIDLNSLAVRYFRRRIVQRTFYQTVDLLDEPFDPTLPDPLLATDMWADRASRTEADVVFSGRIGLTTTNESRVVTERIRTPSGEVTEVARFREMTGYQATVDLMLINGADGEVLILSEGLTGEREFAADEGVEEGDAIIETFEELLPEIVDALTPARREQTRNLIY